MSIVDTPEKDGSKVDRKLYKRKNMYIFKNSSSTLFSCSIREMYNRVHRHQNKYLILKSYITGINTSILPTKKYENIFPEK